jgi:hypothetical protein
MTASAPLMPKLAILTITFQRVICQDGFKKNDNANWQSQELKMEILDILPIREDDRHCVFIGRKSGGTVKAYYVEVQKLKDKMETLHYDFKLDLKCENWVAGRDSVTTIDAAQKGDGMILLIARLEDSGFVRRVIRPVAPNI